MKARDAKVKEVRDKLDLHIAAEERRRTKLSNARTVMRGALRNFNETLLPVVLDVCDAIDAHVVKSKDFGRKVQLPTVLQDLKDRIRRLTPRRPADVLMSAVGPGL